MADRKIKNELDTDYRLIGIATSLKEYKLCFHLNELLECDFRKLKDLSFEPKDRTRSLQFSVFKAISNDSKNDYIVFTNKTPGGFLLPEISHFDYIIHVSGKCDDHDIVVLAEGIKGLPEVVMSAEVPLKKIKSRERLVYEEEKPARKLLTTKRWIQ